MDDLNNLIKQMRINGNADIRGYEVVMLLIKVSNSISNEFESLNKRVSELEARVTALRVLN